ncbi:hypothetical protein [Methyloversatilis sp.]|uniref:hypothetical protein n=1 Tax=Methyloversatilis sp. TaxID=2569862 RepID=UPI0027B97205|nr:hypothetical protein [Methyloversatilis sp.]
MLIGWPLRRYYIYAHLGPIPALIKTVITLVFQITYATGFIWLCHALARTLVDSYLAQIIFTAIIGIFVSIIATPIFSIAFSLIAIPITLLIKTGSNSKNKERNALEKTISSIYSNTRPSGEANLEEAIFLASSRLLGGLVDHQLVIEKAISLKSGSIPYSTHDLALSVAWAFFREPVYSTPLESAQINARIQSVEWLNDGLVAPLLAKAFEDDLYERYKIK